MISKLTINGFRGLGNVVLDKMGSVCLITGDNSAGKTAVLESIYFSLATSNQLPLMPNSFRPSFNQKNRNAISLWDNYWLWLFSQKSLPNKFSTVILYDNNSLVVSAGADAGLIDINYTFNNSAVGKLQMRNAGSVGQVGQPFPRPKVTVFSSQSISAETDAEKFSAVSATQNGEDQLLALVRIIDDRIKKLRYLKLPNNNHALVYVDVGLNNLIPSSQLGQGFCTLLSLCLEILASGADVVLVDEIENGLHRDSLGKIWDGLAKTIQSRNIQLIATTHSKECINAAYSASVENESISFSNHSLKLKGSVVTCQSSEGII